MSDHIQSRPLSTEGRENYDRIFRKPVCRRCGGTMKQGVAIQQTYVGHPDFPGDTGCETGCTVSAGGPGKLVDAMKCEACGHSHHLP